MTLTNKKRRKMSRIHKRLIKLHNAINGIKEQLAGCEDDDLKDVSMHLGNAQLSLYYASRVFENGDCSLAAKWEKK